MKHLVVNWRRSTNSVKQVDYPLNVEKNKLYCHKSSIKHKIPAKMPALKKENKINERTSSIKFLGVKIGTLNENLSWKDHIKTVEDKLAKNAGLLYCAKKFLNKTSLKTMYFSYIR